jgi:hypothetical protein
MNQQEYIIKFNSISVAEANWYASELRSTLLDSTPDVTVERKRDDIHTQDFGSTLVLILGTSTVTTIAKVLGDWLKLRNSVSLTIESAEGKVIVNNLTSKESLHVIQNYLTHK